MAGVATAQPPPPPAVHGPEAHTATCLPLPWKASCGQSGRDRPEFILTTCPPPAPARPPWLPGPFRPRPRLPGGGPLLRAPLENPGGVLVSTVRPREATAVVHSAELVPTSFLNVPVGSRTCSLRTPPTRAPPATSARGGAMARRPAQLLAGDSAFGRRGARREAGLRPRQWPGGWHLLGRLRSRHPTPSEAGRSWKKNDVTEVTAAAPRAPG